MTRVTNKSNIFSVTTALYLCLWSAFWLAGILLFFEKFDWEIIVPFFCGTFFIAFLIFQYRMKKFVLTRVNAIYKDLDMIEGNANPIKLVNSDINTFLEEVKAYAKVRKTEMETLKVRDAYRKEFLGNVSHELKTPLFTIQGYILTLLDGAKNKPELCEKYLKRASKGVDRLSYIIEDLDLITRLEVGDLILDLEIFDLVSLIQNVFELLEIKASKKNIALDFDMAYKPIYVKADKERIRQVLTNLIVNSVKYGHEDGTTEVSIQELVDSKIIIRVTDNGEGIKKEHIPRLFERFYRVSASRSREEGGSGLGLSIVKHIIEAHSEHIYIESVLGIGSEFSFTLEKASSNEVVLEKASNEIEEEE